jgi:hypothetical protein
LSNYLHLERVKVVWGKSINIYATAPDR